MALVQLGLDAPPVGVVGQSAFFQQAAPPATFAVPPSAPFVEELQRCWADPRQFSHIPSECRALANMRDASSYGLDRMPTIEPALAALILSPDEALRPDAHCPRPQCRLTDDFIVKSYDAVARAACIGNSLSHLTLAMSETLQSSGAEQEVQDLSEASLQAFAYMSRELGRLKSSLTLARRHVWLAQSPLSEASRRALRTLPVVPGQLFRVAAQQALERTLQVTQARQQFASSHRVPPRSRRLAVSTTTSRLDDGLAPSTIKVYIATISARHNRVDGVTVWSNTLVSRFLKGAQRLRPPQRSPRASWDLPLVLQVLGKPPFEPLGGSELKWLSMKTAFLLAIASAKRVGELSISRECLHWSPDGTGVTLWPNPSFLPKTFSASYVNQPLSLAALTPPTEDGGQTHGETLLCPDIDGAMPCLNNDCQTGLRRPSAMPTLAVAIQSLLASEATLLGG
ncbi:hypothetical protein N1851_021814 [Merluccius polli]|uniref:Uncharacterized protein n=1 Tax=Merluccius polli TaxID=89951 RepID=A0AA47NZ40_MERPO|nr:hypothetical protein N1851_021814 [Merluccius polli]